MTTCYPSEGLRYLRERHHDQCEGGCDGCQVCTERHCQVCGTHVTYAQATCGECIDETRRDLRALVELYAALPEEREHRGIWSEAAMLAAPTADYEAWTSRRAAISLRTGKPLNDLGDDGDDTNPEWVLKQWTLLLCEDYGEEYDRAPTVVSMADWIDARLGRIAHDVGQDFGQFRREIRRVRRHLELVLRDGEQVETGAPCMKCRIPLRREYGKLAAADGWRCPKCKEWRSDVEYRRNVAELHMTNATHLTAAEFLIRDNLKPGTLRAWAARGLVESKSDSGRTVYAICDVDARLREKSA